MTAASVFNPTVGIVNSLVTLLGGTPVPWFGDPVAAMAAVVLIDAWQWSPSMMPLTLAALTSTRLGLYEAARVDGARWHPIIRYIEVSSVLDVLLLGTVPVACNMSASAGPGVRPRRACRGVSTAWVRHLIVHAPRKTRAAHP